MNEKKLMKEKLILDAPRYVGRPVKSQPIFFLLVLSVVLVSFVVIAAGYIFVMGYRCPDFLRIRLIALRNASDGSRNVLSRTTSHPEDKPTAVPSPSCSDVPDIEKFDCYPDAPVTQDQCEKRGCCYHALGDVSNLSAASYPPLGTPFCYYPSNYVGYTIKDIEQFDIGCRAVLVRTLPSGFPEDAKTLYLMVLGLDDNTVMISIVHPQLNGSKVPFYHQVPPKQDRMIAPKYEVKLSPNGTLSIVRISSGVPVFVTDLRRLVFAKQFLQLSSRLPTRFVYGLGEHYDRLLRSVQWTRTTLFNRDNFPVPNKQLYGSHAFYIGLEEDNSTHGVLLMNTHATDVILQPTPAVTFRPIGGPAFGFLVFLGPTPDEVIQQYSLLTGTAFMPPYWSLGFHLCRYGYKSLNNTRAVWDRTRKAEIPFDTQWNDIDYMKNQNDFTYDKENFSGLPEFVKELHDNGMHYVIIVDPGISNAEEPGTYPPYDDGLKADIFVKNSSGDIFVGKVWNTVSTVFPDFSHPAALNYWRKQFQDFHSIVPFDGAWIDMNEPSNFYDGQKDGCPDSSYENPPYVPGGLEPLRSRTLCMTAKHFVGLHYEVHNVYAYLEAMLTHLALANITQQRPFIISRATFAGQGRWSGHWSGDIGSSWEDMRYSVVDLLNFNIFGMPMMGSDICGFRDDTTVELCARWSALGAFYPFSRNHNDLGRRDQDPVALGDTVVKAARNSLTTRYKLLPYLYYLFYESHVYGKTVSRPLFFEFVNDPVTYDIDEQFMWGSALMIMPALHQGVTTIEVYFPNAVWYDYYTGERIKANKSVVKLPAPLDTINLAFRGGYVIPHQHNNLTTTDSRKNKFFLLVGLDSTNCASGALYWDDGESIGTYESGKYNLIKFSVTNGILTSNISTYGYEVNMDLDYIKVCALASRPSKVTVNSKNATYTFDKYNCLKITAGVSLRNQLHVTWN